jgi:Sulfotransferase domain
MNALRIAVISSPRSGNTWVRSVLGDILRLQQFAVHNYIELENIPDRCIVQLHWYREPNLQRFLNDRRFKTLVLARHPLDVLVSILNFIRHEPKTARWLEGNAEIPPSLAGQAPTSQDFLKYSKSWGAENVLGVSYQWWHDPDAIKVRYEELVQRPHEALLNLARVFDPAARDEDDAIGRFGLPFFQGLPNKHGWQGRPDLWRQLIVYSDARAIYRRHKRIFDVMGYSVRPYLLTRAAALQRWKELTLEKGTGPVHQEPQRAG